MSQTAEPGTGTGDLSPEGTHVWDGHDWEPLWLQRDDVVEACRTCFGREPGTPEFLAEGLTNQSWRVDTEAPDGDGAYVLRVSGPELSRAQIGYEHAVAGGLHEQVAEVIAPVPGAGGETLQTFRDRMVTLFPHVDGTTGAAVDPDIRADQAARILARIHRAGTDRGFGQRPGGRAVDEPPRLTWPAVRPILEQELRRDEEVGELFAFFDQEVDALDAWLDGLRESGRTLTRGLVHGDFGPRNLMFTHGHLAGVVDWDFCHADILAFEVADAALGTLGALNAAGADPTSFWRTYLDAGGPLAIDDADLLGGFARIGALSELGYALDGRGRAKPWATEIMHGVVADITRRRDRADRLAAE